MLKSINRRIGLLSYLNKNSLIDLLLYLPKDELIGMTIKWEQAYLKRYAQKEYSGLGEIVDYGCWLGSSTIPLAMGLESNQRVKEKDKRIYAYDIFIWQSWMDGLVNNTSVAGKFRPGESFVEEFNQLITHWQNLIEVKAGNINQIGWEGKPIECLHNDASKTWGLTNTMIHQFYPFLIPGGSQCIEQDFTNYYTPWINLINYRLKDYLVPLFHVPYSSTVVFQYQTKIPDELLKTTYEFSSFSEQEIDATFEYALSLVSKDKHANVMAAKVMVYVHSGDMERAWYEFTKAKDMGYYEKEMVLVKNRYFADR